MRKGAPDKTHKGAARNSTASAPAEVAAPPTSYDVAQLAGVSQSAVSRCFRPDASISAKMRERVLAAAARLGYSPDAIARSLSTRRSGLIGVVISNLTNLYYPEVLSELNAHCVERAVHPLLFTIRRESDVERVLGNIWQYRLDGVIVAARLTLAQVREFERRNVPLVFYNRHLFEGASNAVCCDQVGGANLIVDALAEAGLRRIGLVGGPKDSVVAAERLEGCLKRLAVHGIKSVVTVTGDFTYAGGRAAFGQIVRRLKGHPDAVIAVNDMMGLGCMDGARYDHHLKVPEEVSIVGFDGIEPTQWAGYELATFRQPVQQMAGAAVGLLLDRVADPTRPPEQRVFAGTLVRGSSAKFVPGSKP